MAVYPKPKQNNTPGVGGAVEIAKRLALRVGDHKFRHYEDISARPTQLLANYFGLEGGFFALLYTR
tara:strand:+ start:1559 stop:1756 length:198 start_codon:yes stop_codon:yes gene_type:complete